jgi:predicted O-methyltransferase YrrM
METVDYLFIDGHHKLKPTLNYFEQCLPFLSEKAVIVMDDINWSDEMREAWKKLQQHPRVTVSMDLFMLGILLIDKDLSKESFRIRY